MRPSEIKEEVDTLITEVSHFVNVQNLEVLARLGQRHQTFRVKVSTVEQVEVGQLGEIGKQLHSSQEPGSGKVSRFLPAAV